MQRLGGSGGVIARLAFDIRGIPFRVLVIGGLVPHRGNVGSRQPLFGALRLVM
jgi:hypothetical protein